METKRIKHKVIMLPTKFGTDALIDLYTNGDIIFNNQNISRKWEEDKGGWQPQHLYITSDDEIKEGDWFLYTDDAQLTTVQQYNGKDNLRQSDKKIIANTDKSLTIIEEKGVDNEHNWERQLAQTPQSFIEEYCKVGGIDEVMVEYEKDYYKSRMLSETNDCSKWDWQYNLKLNSQNEITIHLIEEKMYSTKEVKVLIKKYEEDTLYYGRDSYYKNIDIPGDWIKENL